MSETLQPSSDRKATALVIAALITADAQIVQELAKEASSSPDHVAMVKARAALIGELAHEMLSHVESVQGK